LYNSLEGIRTLDFFTKYVERREKPVRKNALVILVTLAIGNVLFLNCCSVLAISANHDSGFLSEKNKMDQLFGTGYDIFSSNVASDTFFGLYITPAPEEVNSLLGARFTATVWIENIVKMKGFSIDIYWNAYLHNKDPCPGINGVWYTTLLTTEPSNVVVNDALFPSAICTPTITVTGSNGTAPACGWTNFDWRGHVHVDDTLPTGWPLINATYPPRSLWLFNVTFMSCDPWYCGAQPDYQPKPNHYWSLENASTPIYFSGGSINSCCAPTPLRIGVDLPANDTLYVFAPITGDLNGDGQVDIVDLMIEAGYYGYPGVGRPFSCPDGVPADFSSTAWPAYYDLNNDGNIDIYDMVIVAKNLGGTASTGQ
jgi:hypothetical protein